jgi:hypothetical protein
LRRRRETRHSFLVLRRTRVSRVHFATRRRILWLLTICILRQPASPCQSGFHRTSYDIFAKRRYRHRNHPRPTLRLNHDSAVSEYAPCRIQPCSASITERCALQNENLLVRQLEHGFASVSFSFCKSFENTVTNDLDVSSVLNVRVVGG